MARIGWAAWVLVLATGCGQQPGSASPQPSAPHSVQPIGGATSGTSGTSGTSPIQPVTTGGGGTSSGTGTSAPRTSGSSSGTTTATTTSTGGGFTPAPHAAFPSVPRNGGSVLDHPQLVAITYDSDSARDHDEGYLELVAGTSWLSDVGAQYGVQGASVAAKIHLGDALPAQLDDADIQDLLRRHIRDGSVPAPTGALSEALYVVFFPAGTTITAQGLTSCSDFGAYHNFTQGVGPYAVVPTCAAPTGSAFDAQAGQELSLSHELIEAATDPAPASGWALTDPSDPWSYLGGELGDLCVDQGVQVQGHWLQRVWSNRTAAAGGDPCGPSSGQPYFSVTTPAGIVGPGSVDVTGWSEAEVGSWTVSLYLGGGTFTPGVSWVKTTITNGQTTPLALSAPSNAKSGDWALVLLVSQRTAQDFNLWPLLVRVP